MAIAIDKANMAEGFDSSVGSGDPTMTFATNQAVVANGFIVIGIVWWSSGAVSMAVTGATGGSLTWAVDAQEESSLGGNNPHTAIISAQAPAGLASSTNITVTWNVAAGGAAAYAGSSFTGVATSSALDVANTTPGDTSGTSWATPSLSIAAGSMIFGCAYNIDATAAWSTATAGTEAHDFGDAAFAAMAANYRIESSSGSYSVGGTTAAQNVTAIAAAYKEAVGGAEPGPTLRLNRSGLVW